MIDVAGRIAVVTGASSGLGRRFSTDLAEGGATVVCIARRKDLLEETVEQCRRSAPASEARPADVSDVEAFCGLLRSIEDDHGRIDILINNAGVSERVPLAEQDLAHYRRILETNFMGAVAGTLAVLPGMRQRRHGSVVNVSSDAARTPAPPYGAYSASKAGLSAFTEAVAHEVAPDGVRAHVLYPGWVASTAMGAGAFEAGRRTPPRFTKRTEEQVSRLMLKKMGGAGIEINALRSAVWAPLVRSLLPRFYARQVRSRS